MVAAQRQGHADFANRAVMDYRQEIVGGLSAGRGKGGNIRAAVAGSDYGDYIALGIPERAVAIIVGLPILRINILGGCDGILRTGQRAGFISEIAAFRFACHPRVNAARLRLPAGQHLAGLANGQLAKGFMVGILFANYQRVHAVFVFIAGCLINAVGGDGEVHIETAICIIGQNPVFVACSILPFVVESVRAGDFHNAIFTQRQFFRQRQVALAVGVESVYIFCQMAVDSIGHCDELRVAVAVITIMPLLVQPVDLESGVGQQYRFAGFLVNFCDAEINFDFLVQYRKFLIAVRACHYAVLGGSHSAPRVVILSGVNGDNKRLSLEQVMRHSCFDNEICSIG